MAANAQRAARRVLLDPVEDADRTIAERALDLPYQPCLGTDPGAVDRDPRGLRVA